MAERPVTVLNRKGLHVRPAAAFAQQAARFKSHVTVTKDGRTVNAKSSLELLMLAAVPGAALVIRAEGEDAQAAVDELAKFVENRFGMDEDD